MTNTNQNEAGAIQLGGVSETLVASTERALRSLGLVIERSGRGGFELRRSGNFIRLGWGATKAACIDNARYHAAVQSALRTAGAL